MACALRDRAAVVKGRRSPSAGAAPRYRPQPLPQPGESKRRALPAGEVLPPVGWTGPWFDQDKHAVVAAVACGQVVLSRALGDYRLSLEEFAGWYGSFRHGPVLSPTMVERRVLLNEVWEWLRPE